MDGVKYMPSASTALGKASSFTMRLFDGASLPSIALDKGFAECKHAFAECIGHSAKRPYAVVYELLCTIFNNKNKVQI
jgi:hypothetical protein